MTTSELISYIKKQTDNGISKDLIISKLLNAGWHREDIDEGFSQIEEISKPDNSFIDIDKDIEDSKHLADVKSLADKYREPIGEDTDLEVKKEPEIMWGLIKEEPHQEIKITEIPKVEIPKVETPKIEVPKVEIPVTPMPAVETLQTITPPAITPKVTIPVIDTLEIKSANPETEKPKITIPLVEIPKVSIPIVDIPKIQPTIPAQENIITEKPKVWTPMGIPVSNKEQPKNIAPKTENVEEIVSQNQELSSSTTNISVKPLETKNVNKTVDITKPQSVNKQAEIIPTLNQKPEVNSFGYKVNNKIDASPVDDIPEIKEDNLPQKTLTDLSKVAMISSYGSDMLYASKHKGEILPKKKNFKKMKFIIIIIAIILIIGASWAVVSGKINIPFIKKDPKVLILNYSKTLSSLKSYKTETNIEISSPSFSDISRGLIDGEAVSSLDTDSISIKTLGTIDQNGGGFISDNFITIKSSLLSDDIVSDIKNDGTNLFVSIPDLSQVIKENAPEPTVVKINEQQFNLIPSLFSSGLEETLNKINLYKILSSGVSSYINNDTLGSYNNFIKNVEISEKGQETIKGIDTYHYTVNVDRQLSKELLSKITNNFSLNLSDTDKEELTQILGATTIDSFDVWVGKGDNNIYQYSVVLGVPLSKIVGFEDKSIGDNQIKLSWQTTYYDFDVPNNIYIPETSVEASDFVKGVNKMKIKNEVYSFKQLATNLRNAEGSYGIASNKTGSCMSPTSGSLFSPLGHKKGATVAVSAVSSLLNSVLSKTNGAGACYSTPKGWSFTIPLADSYELSDVPVTGYQSFFCVDSAGVTKELTVPPTSIVCE